MASIKYAPKLPLELDDNKKFIIYSDVLSNIRQKILTILLTSPGERIMDPRFGIGIKKYIFEQTSGMLTVEEDEFGEKEYIRENIQSSLYQKLFQQVNWYCNDVTILNLDIDIEENVMNLKINYTYKDFIPDIFEVTIGG